MSKHIFISYRNGSEEDLIIDNVKNVCDLISPEDLELNHVVTKINAGNNSYVGIQNTNNSFDLRTHLLIGAITQNELKYSKIGDPIPDGSYAMIRYNQNHLEFFNDCFGSKTLWYFLDDEKLVISDSQRAIVNLKKKFEPNLSTLSWFLSSGSQGPFLSWDRNIEMIKPFHLYSFDFKNWKLDAQKINYEFENSVSKKTSKIQREFNKKIKASLLKIANHIPSNNILIPLSGGYDSRLIFNITTQHKELDNISSINWGKKPTEENFDDKIAARKIANFHNRKLIDSFLPNFPDNYISLIDSFVKSGDCRIDHINAFTDNFSLWKDLFRKGYKVIVRGDIPFTEGIDVNNKMTRAHIGISKFSDYRNSSDYNLEKYSELQHTSESMNKKSSESFIEWRDRLYVEYRIPLVISSFADLSNCFIESRSPIMSGELFSMYSQLPNRQKGNKKVIAKLSKSLDQTNVPFNASPSIPALTDVFFNKEGIKFLKKSLTQIDNELITPGLINDVINKLERHQAEIENSKSSFLSVLKSFLSEHLPLYLKGFLKSKQSMYLHPITLAYRLVLADRALIMYRGDSN